MFLEELAWLRVSSEPQDSNIEIKQPSNSTPTITPPFETDVLIIGAGPAGASLASFLARDKISTLLISSASSTAREPRAHFTNLTTMDSLRDLGLESECHALAQAGENVRHIRWADTMAGDEYARVAIGGQPALGVLASPSQTCDLPQTLLEPVLVRYASMRGVRIRYDTEFVRFTRGRGDGKVLSYLKDLISGVEYTVLSRYLCGADGGRSVLVEQLALPMVSRPGLPAYNILVNIDLTKLMTHRKGILHNCLMRSHNSPFICLWRAVKPWTEWTLIVLPKPGQVYETPTTEQWKAVVRESIGDVEMADAAEIRGVSKWLVNETYATRYSEGNVFCLGDAVHRHPPNGGLGSNTCIADAANLAWKLNFVLRGYASPKLLETYTTERASIGERVVKFANRALKDYTAVFDALGVMLNGAHERHSMPGAERTKLRKQLRESLALVADNEMNALGIEMGHLYTSRAIYLADEEAPFSPRGSGALDYTPSTYPGRRLPHAWLNHRQPAKPISTIDLAGKGRFCVFTGPNGYAWVEAARSVSEQLGALHINAYQIGFGQEWKMSTGVGRGCVRKKRSERTGVCLCDRIWLLRGGRGGWLWIQVRSYCRC